MRNLKKYDSDVFKVFVKISQYRARDYTVSLCTNNSTIVHGGFTTKKAAMKFAKKFFIQSHIAYERVKLPRIPELAGLLRLRKAS